MVHKMPAKTIEQLRESAFHQQLGRKLCAALIAQQQGIQLNTAFNKMEEPLGDFWLQLAETVRVQWAGDSTWDVPGLEEPSRRLQ